MSAPKLTESFERLKRIRSKIRFVESGCAEWIGSRDEHGYGTVVWNGKTRKAHRLAFELEHGSIGLGMCVCHRCDNPACVNLDHLFVGTASDNMRDMVGKGRGRNQISKEQSHFKSGHSPRGEHASGHKLTEADALEILKMHADGWTTRTIVDRFNVDRTTIQKLIRGDTWKHLAGHAALRGDK